MKDFIDIDGKQLRVEANWNAQVAFLEAQGRNTLDHITDLQSLRPSDLTYLAAACINEGERLEGHDCHITAMELGARPDAMIILNSFLTIYAKQVTAVLPAEPKKD